MKKTRKVVRQLSGVEQIAEERRRQITEERWTEDHDDTHICGEMAIAAKCYCEQAVGRRWLEPKKYQKDPPADDWPWDTRWWKPQSPIRDLVRAGALIAAEIDRLQRAAGQDK